MPSIKCNRCKRVFPILAVPFDAKQSYVCDYQNCTRSYSEGNRATSDEPYQTPMNISNTVKAAIIRKESGFPVDNGGCQEGTINA